MYYGTRVLAAVLVIGIVSAVVFSTRSMWSGGSEQSGSNTEPAKNAETVAVVDASESADDKTSEDEQAEKPQTATLTKNESAQDSKDKEAEGDAKDSDANAEQDANAPKPAVADEDIDAKTAASDWIEGEACASSVAETGTVTASGISFNDDSPQIGLDAASNPAVHFGDYVEVRYGDASVRAQVVDYGAYGGGSTGILINPGVFRLLGAGSVGEWGRRTVTYRFLK